VVALIRRAEGGDQAALPAVRELLAKTGVAATLGGDLARRAQDTLLAAFAGANLLAREATARRMEELRAELAGATPTPVERLLAERAVACWLHLYHLENSYAGKASMTLDLGAYYQRCIDRAHKRYLSALKALADVRKLALPALQVNIARKQVNVACGCA
jgi:hypothetical protein